MTPNWFDYAGIKTKIHLGFFSVYLCFVVEVQYRWGTFFIFDLPNENAIDSDIHHPDTYTIQNMLIHQQKFPSAAMKKSDGVSNHQNPITKEGSEKTITGDVFAIPRERYREWPELF